MSCSYSVCSGSALAQPMPCVNGIVLTKGTLQASTPQGIFNYVGATCDSSCIAAIINAYKFWGLTPPSAYELCPPKPKPTSSSSTTTSNNNCVQPMPNSSYICKGAYNCKQNPNYPYLLYAPNAVALGILQDPSKPAGVGNSLAISRINNSTPMQGYGFVGQDLYYYLMYEYEPIKVTGTGYGFCLDAKYTPLSGVTYYPVLVHIYCSASCASQSWSSFVGVVDVQLNYSAKRQTGTVSTAATTAPTAKSKGISWEWIALGGVSTLALLYVLKQYSKEVRV